MIFFFKKKYHYFSLLLLLLFLFIFNFPIPLLFCSRPFDPERSDVGRCIRHAYQPFLSGLPDWLVHG